MWQHSLNFAKSPDQYSSFYRVNSMKISKIQGGGTAPAILLSSTSEAYWAVCNLEVLKYKSSGNNSKRSIWPSSDTIPWWYVESYRPRTSYGKFVINYNHNYNQSSNQHPGANRECGTGSLRGYQDSCRVLESLLAIPHCAMYNLINISRVRSQTKTGHKMICSKQYACALSACPTLRVKWFQMLDEEVRTCLNKLISCNMIDLIYSTENQLRNSVIPCDSTFDS